MLNNFRMSGTWMSSNKLLFRESRDVVQLAECLPNIPKALGSIARTHKSKCGGAHLLSQHSRCRDKRVRSSGSFLPILFFWGQLRLHEILAQKTKILFYYGFNINLCVKHLKPRKISFAVYTLLTHCNQPRTPSQCMHHNYTASVAIQGFHALLLYLSKLVPDMLLHYESWDLCCRKIKHKRDNLRGKKYLIFYL